MRLLFISCYLVTDFLQVNFQKLYFGIFLFHVEQKATFLAKHTRTTAYPIATKIEK